MKKIKISYMMIFLCITSIIKANSITLSFDSLFPMTWYQKGLESSLQVWQTLVTTLESNEDQYTLSCEELLGRLAFVQFCINQMHQEKRKYIVDDIAYLLLILQKVQELLMVVISKPLAMTQDFIACVNNILQSIQDKLKSLL